MGDSEASKTESGGADVGKPGSSFSLFLYLAIVWTICSFFCGIPAFAKDNAERFYWKENPINKIPENERTKLLFWDKDEPSGFMQRNAVIRENLLVGAWKKVEFFFSPRYQKTHEYITPGLFKLFLESGMADDELKGTEYSVYLNEMRKMCHKNIKPGSIIHIVTYNKHPEWNIFSTNISGIPVYRELYFRCLTEGNRTNIED